MRCTLGAHAIVGAPKYFSDERHIKFLKKTRKEFRPSHGVCENCYKNIIRVYQMKRASAIKKLKEQRSKSAKQSVSDPSITSTTVTSSRTRNDSYDKMVFRTPRNPNLKTVVSETRLETTGNESSSEESTTTTTSGSVLNYATQSQSEGISSSNTSERRLASSRNQASPLDTQPSTSAAAAAAAALRKQKARNAQNAYDPWDDVPSPAALDGTRLPHVQPIIKKTQFVTLNKDFTSIYLKEITGG